MTILERAKKDKADVFLKTAGLNMLTVERDINSIDSEVSEDEKILAIIAGKLVQTSNDRSRGIGFSNGGRQATGTDSKGALVITDHQAIFVDKRMFGKQTTVITGDMINSVSQSAGIMSAKVVISSFGSNYDITDLKKDAANSALKALKVLKKNAKSSAGGNTTVHQAASGMEEIKKAKELLDAGIIDQKEFDAIKAKHLK